jgi:type I restriction-modification system DNA methylase subunit
MATIVVYKGLGEEPKISKYEDYFVKRSLDSLKPNGILAMVLPSGWLNRQNQLKNAEMIGGFSFPNGAFAGTQVGTDIIILKKPIRKYPIIFPIILKTILKEF